MTQAIAKPEPFRPNRFNLIGSNGTPEELTWDTQCVNCFQPMPRGTLAVSNGYAWVHPTCPKFADRCSECFMEHAGECL